MNKNSWLSRVLRLEWPSETVRDELITKCGDINLLEQHWGPERTAFEWRWDTFNTRMRNVVYWVTSLLLLYLVIWVLIEQWGKHD